MDAENKTFMSYRRSTYRVNNGWEMSSEQQHWNFLSNYAHVLICLTENPQARMREVADQVGLTERTVLRLITRLDEAGILKRSRRGRRNFYEITVSTPLPHPLEARCSMETLLRTVLGPDVEMEECR